MKKNLIIVLSLLGLFTGCLFSQPAILWDKTYGGKQDTANKSPTEFKTILPIRDNHFLLFGESSATSGFEKSEPRIGGSSKLIRPVTKSGTGRWAEKVWI